MSCTQMCVQPAVSDAVRDSPVASGAAQSGLVSGKVAHFDASVASSVLAEHEWDADPASVDGDAGRINDLVTSGSVHARMATAASRGTYRNGINGLNYIEFRDSTSQHFDLNSQFMTGATAGTMQVVWRDDGIKGNATHPFSFDANHNSIRWTDGKIHESFGTDTRVTGSTDVHSLITSVHIYEVVVDAAGNWLNAINGTTIDTATGITVAWSGFPRINHAGSTLYGDISFCEAVFYSSALSTADRLTNRTHLASKWNITL